MTTIFALNYEKLTKEKELSSYEETKKEHGLLSPDEIKDNIKTFSERSVIKILLTKGFESAEIQCNEFIANTLASAPPCQELDYLDVPPVVPPAHRRPHGAQGGDHQ